MLTIGIINDKMDLFNSIKDKKKVTSKFKPSFMSKPIKFEKKIINNSNTLFDDETPIFINNFIEVRKNIKQIEDIVNEIKFNLKKKLQNTFKSNNNFDDKININLKKGFNLIKQSESLIKQLESFKKEENNLNKENTLINHFKIFLNNCLREKVTSIRNEENIFAKSMKAKNNNNLVSKFDFLEKDDEIMFDDDGDQIEILQMENQNDNKEFDVITERITSLSNLMNQLSEMSYNQGEMIDRIDLNIEKSLQNVKKGNNELIKAKEYLESGFAAKIIKFLAFLNIIVFIALIIKKTF